MIYYVLRWWCKMALWVNFRKVYLEYAERVPDDQSVVYGLNHPTAFIDPIALGTHIDGRAWYMLRGDKFVNAPVKWFLHKIHNLPIWNQRISGRDALRRNIETLAFATDRMAEGQPVIILSEGLCRHERRLRPIQRGTARMLFQAWKKNKDAPVAIVPVGANYTDPNAFRSSLTLSFGEPIYARDYAEAFRADGHRTIDEVTALLERRLRELVIHVEDPARDGLVDKLLPLIQNSRPDSGVAAAGGDSPFRAEQWAAVERVNAMDDVAARSLEGEIDRYARLLRESDVTDSGLANAEYATAWRALGLILTSPIAVFGYLANLPAAALVQRQTDKRVTNPQFYASVRYGLGMGVYAAYLLLWTLLAAVVFRWGALLVPVAFPLAGHFYLRWSESSRLWQRAARTGSLSDDARARLRTLRADLLAGVGVAWPAPPSPPPATPPAPVSAGASASVP